MTVTIVIDLEDGSPRSTIAESIRPVQTASEVIAAVLGRLGRDVVPSNWVLVFQGAALPHESQLAECLPLENMSLELVLKPRSFERALVAHYDASAEDGDNELFVAYADDFELGAENPSSTNLGVTSGSDASAHAPASLTPPLADDLNGRRPRQTGTNLKRHATVRYFRRMNPDVLYPLMVLITRKAVEDVKADRLGQRSVSGLAIRTDDPVEIEPLLPGCDCVPQKIVARLEAGDLSAVFRMHPRAVGRLEGATVVIRQNHAVIAEIPLEMRVSRKLWAILLGVATFVLPAISALLKHFGLDFETQAGQGFDLYLAVARVIFDQLSPTVLTAVLGLCTGLVWWSCRPRAEDVFWDLGVAGPETRLRRVREELRKGSPEAIDELLAVVSDFPDHGPARLLLAEWHFQSEAYEPALDAYTLSFRHGAGLPKDYLRASLAASHLGDKGRALRILLEAESRFGEARMLPTMLFNAGCYCALLDDPRSAMKYLRRAVTAGATNIAMYTRDADLDSLRDRSDFRDLINSEELTLHFKCPNCRCECSAAVGASGTRRQCFKCKSPVLVPSAVHTPA